MIKTLAATAMLGVVFGLPAPAHADDSNPFGALECGTCLTPPALIGLTRPTS